MAKSDASSPAGPRAEAANGEQTAKWGSGEVVSVFTALATIVGPVVAVVALRGPQQEVAVIVLAFLTPLSLLVLAARRRARGWPIVGPVLISALAGALAIAGFAWWHASHQSQPGAKPRSPGERGSAGRQPHLPPVHLRFVDPQPGDIVKQCPRIDGAGTIPAGYGLWIVVVPDTKMHPNLYWIEARARPAGTGFWKAAESVSIGSPLVKKPINASIYGVLLDKQWNHYFAISSATGNFYATSLPPTLPNGIIGPVDVIRLGGIGTCR